MGCGTSLFQGVAAALALAYVAAMVRCVISVVELCGDACGVANAVAAAIVAVGTDDVVAGAFVCCTWRLANDLLTTLHVVLAALASPRWAIVEFELHPLSIMI